MDYVMSLCIRWLGSLQSVERVHLAHCDIQAVDCVHCWIEFNDRRDLYHFISIKTRLSGIGSFMRMNAPKVPARKNGGAGRK